MTLDKTTLHEYMTHYGTDIKRWPEELQLLGYGAQQQPELAALFEEEQRFESALNDQHHIPVSAGLAERIIQASLVSTSGSGVAPWKFFNRMDALIPAAVAAMLVLGFVIGLGVPTPSSLLDNQRLSMQSYTDDVEASL